MFPVKLEASVDSKVRIHELQQYEGFLERRGCSQTTVLIHKPRYYAPSSRFLTMVDVVALLKIQRFRCNARKAVLLYFCSKESLRLF